jgi:hypothetical protein
MTILIPPIEIGLVLDLKTFDSLYINNETSLIIGMFEGEEYEVFDFNKKGINFSPSSFTYKVTASAMGLIIQTIPK